MSIKAIFGLAVVLASCGTTSWAVAQEQKAAPVSTIREYKAGAVTVRAPWARATPGGAKVAGIFLELIAAAGSEDRLIGARSPVSGVVEIHDHIDDGGVMRMRRIEAVPIKGATTVTLKPGGLHVMLMDLANPLKAGEAVKLTLLFEKAGALEIEVPVAPIGAQHGSSSGSGSGSGSGPSR